MQKSSMESRPPRGNGETYGWKFDRLRLISLLLSTSARELRYP